MALGGYIEKSSASHLVHNKSGCRPEESFSTKNLPIESECIHED